MLKYNFAKFSLFCVFAVASKNSWAYAHFISYGYSSCLTCHYNAAGNGPLTDYGRALYATAISAKYGSLSDEERGEASGFLGETSLGSHIRPSIDFRGVLVQSNLNQSSSRQTTFIPMQSDANLVLSFLEGKLFGSFTAGADSRVNAEGKRKPSFISREHYLAYRMENGLSVYTGHMDVLYGLRIPEHVAFSRAQTLMAENDQNHGAFLHYAKEKWEAGLHALAGNLYEDADTRIKGLSTQVEFDTWKHGRIGTSVAYLKNNYRSRVQGSVHLKSQILKEGSGLIGELGWIQETNAATSAKTQSPYLFLQPNMRITRGLHVFVNAEYFHRLKSVHQFKASPGLQYFPMQRVELRWDIVSAWNSGANSTLSLSSLLHAHLSF